MCDTTQYKIIFLGDTNVGKTSFITRFTEDTFTDNHITTIGIDYRIKNLVRNEKKIKLQVWDTAGQERYRSIAKSQYNNTDGILLLYDISEKTTFNQISHWLSDIKSKCSDEALIILIGNKCDLPEEQRKVPEAEGKKLAEKRSIVFFEASAKTKYNVDEVMNFVTDQLMAKVKKNGDSKKKELVSPTQLSNAFLTTTSTTHKQSWC